MTRKREVLGSDSAFDYSEGAQAGCLPVLGTLLSALALLVVGVVLMLAAL